MKQKLFFTILVAFFVLTKSNAQQAIVASGGNATGAGGKVSYSVGQIAYTSVTGSGGTVSQGVQQAFEIFTLKGEEFTQITLQAVVYPNPTVSTVTLSVKEFSLDKLNYQLIDILGKNILDGKVTSEETSINLENYPAATYFLKLATENKEIKTFKIIKN